MNDPASCAALMAALARYFDLMYDSVVAQFDCVFQPTARLHGLVGGKIKMLTAEAYKEALAQTPSPKSKRALREEQILLVDFASPTQALAKVRVRIDAIVYVDYLGYHRVDGDWRITSKAFHVESEALRAGVSS